MLKPRQLAALLGLFLLATVSGAGIAEAAQTLHVDLLEKGDGRMVMETGAEKVPAGKVTFDVTNKSDSMEHEFLVAPLKGKPENVPYDDSTGRVREKALKGIHELGDLKPGKSGTMTLDLKAGRYLLFCNKPGHYKAGMYHVLTVTP